MRQLTFACAIIGHARGLRCEVGLALDDPFMLAGQLDKLVGQVASCIARRHRQRPCVGKLSHSLLLLFGEDALGNGGVLNGFSRNIGIGPRNIGCRLGLTPAHENQTRFCLQYVFGQGAIALSLLGLAAQLARARIHIGQNGRQPCQIAFGGAQLLFGILAPDVQAGNARCLLQHLAAFLRLGRDDSANAALADQGRGMCACCRVGEDQRDILRPHIAAIGPIGGTCPPFDPAGDFQFFVCVTLSATVIAFGQYGDFREIARRARGGAGEDHIFHACAAHRLGAAFPHHPAYGFQQVGFAAAIWPDNARKSAFDPKFSGLDKAFEADKFQLLYPQGTNSVAATAMSWPARAIFSVRRPRPACSSLVPKNWRPAWRR